MTSENPILLKFKEDLLEKDPVWLYRKYLLSHNVWYFEHKLGKDNHAELYDDFKCLVAEKLGLHSTNIAIIGSVKLGFSLAPSKNYNSFRDGTDTEKGSDVDIVLVSQEIFREGWDAYLELDRKYHIRDRKSVTNNIFRRFITISNENTNVDFFKKWAQRIGPCKRDLQTIFNLPSDIKYRVYETWDEVEKYHTDGLAKMITKAQENI